MSAKKCLKPFISMLIGLYCLNSFALNERVKKLIEFETQANEISVRSMDMIKVPHVEIPLKYIELDFAKYADKRLTQALIIEKNGEKLVRWILNTEDTVWSDILIKHFQDKYQLNLERQYYFNGYQTSSRSYITEDPLTRI